MNITSMDKIAALCKRRGFIFPGSDIYGGLANSWDYGPYGVELKNNLKQAWWRSVVHERNDVFGLDAAIIMHPKTWEASGHIENFFDIMLECPKCKKRFRLDTVQDKYGDDKVKVQIYTGEDSLKDKTFVESDVRGDLKCLECDGQLGMPRKFNLMFKTAIGSVEDNAHVVYLRPETAQGIFVNFQNILDTKHPKLPFGIAQIGKSFRNEITPGNYTFRTREFEQMEIEYFVRPDESDKYYQEWVDSRYNWYLELGMNKDKLRLRPHGKDELAHYARACTDVEYEFPFGWSELEGIANRADFDLAQHSKLSGKDLRYFDEPSKERFFPHVIEPSGGVDRSVLAFLTDAYFEEEVKGSTRVVLKLHKKLAPVKVAVLPLLKNRPELVALARNLAFDFKKKIVTVYDDTAAIGKLYRRQDEVGTLFCVTVDVQSLDDRKVTVRDRDTMLQERIEIENLNRYLLEKLKD